MADTVSPALDVLVEEPGVTKLIELRDYFIIGETVLEHVADFEPHVSGKAGDFPGGTPFELRIGDCGFRIGRIFDC